jgi:hypothetical protein
LRTRAPRTRDVLGRRAQEGRTRTANLYRDLSHFQSPVRISFLALRSSPSVRSPSPPRRCKTVQRLQDHHIRYYLARNHPIAICVRPLHHSRIRTCPFYPHVRPVLTHLVAPSQTDDILPFRNSMLGEYALLMAPEPFGLGLTENEVETIARMGMESRFRSRLP